MITAEARADLTCDHCRYYNCVHGYPHIYDCPPPLIFDEAQGTCVREEQASSFARKCETAVVKVRNTIIVRPLKIVTRLFTMIFS